MFIFDFIGSIIACADHRFCYRIVNGVPYRFGDHLIVHDTRIYDRFTRCFRRRFGTHQTFGLIMANTRGNPTPTRLTRRIVSHFDYGFIRNRFQSIHRHGIFLVRITIRLNQYITGIGHGIWKVDGCKEDRLVSSTGRFLVYHLIQDGRTRIFRNHALRASHIETHRFMLNGHLITGIHSSSDFVHRRKFSIGFILDEEINGVVNGGFPLELIVKTHIGVIRNRLGITGKNQTIRVINTRSVQNLRTA